MVKELEAARAACPEVRVCQDHAHVNMTIIEAGNSNPASHDYANARTAFALLELAWKRLPLVLDRLKEAESLLCDMADLDGMPMPLIRRYRRALTMIANLDPRAMNPRKVAREALEAYPGPEDDEEEGDRESWEAFYGSLGSATRELLRVRGVSTFDALAHKTDAQLTPDPDSWPGCLDAIYRKLGEFGRPRVDPAIAITAGQRGAPAGSR